MSYWWNSLAAQDGSGLFRLLAISTAKTTLLLAFAALLCFCFRRSSAATRHLLWSSVMCASLALPFFSLLKVWEVPVLPASASVSGSLASTEPKAHDEAIETPGARRPQSLSASSEAMARVVERAEAPTRAGLLRGPVRAEELSAPSSPSRKEGASLRPRLADSLLVVWVIGALLLLFRLLVGFIAAGSLAQSAVEFQDPALNSLFSSLLAEMRLDSSLRLLCSEQAMMPIVCGILRPSVLLPAGAETWPEERQRMVLLHELTHVTRRDCLTQMIAQAASALYWFNPLIWCAARRLRVEREKACDDFVLSVGTRPSDYAHHLLEIARSMRERSLVRWSQTASVAMARRSQLEGRLLAILSGEKREGALSRPTTLALLSVTLLLFVALGLLRPTATNARNSHPAKTSPDESAGAAIFRPGSSALRSEPGADTRAGTLGMEAAFGGEEGGGTTRRRPPEETLNHEQLSDDSEQKTGQAIEPEVNQEIVTSVSQSGPSSPQSPAAGTEADPEATPSGDTEERQERKAGTQERAGDFIDEMAAAGYTNLSVDELVRLKTAGVTAEYVRSLRALGLADLTPKEVASLSVLGVTPEYVQLVRSAGYGDLSARELSAFRVHHITPEYIRTIRDAGYQNLTARELISFAAQRVTPSFISGIRDAGYDRLSPRELVSLRVFDITPDFIRKARGRFGELTVRQLISLRSAGLMEDDRGQEKERG